MTTRVLVVDDQALLRAAFSSLIDAEEDLEVAGEAADGRQAVELAARCRCSAPRSRPSGQGPGPGRGDRATSTASTRT